MAIPALAPVHPPQSEECERAVLAGALLDPDLLPAVTGRLTPQDFFEPRHRVIYKAILSLQQAGSPLDIRTLQSYLEQQDNLEAVGGVAYLASLDLDLPDLGRLDTYVEIVKERSVRRRLIEACGEIAHNCLDRGLEAQEALGRAEQAIATLQQETSVVNVVSVVEWPTLSKVALYGLPGDFVRLVEPHSEADPAALLIQFLVAAGNLIGRGPYFPVEADRHGLNIFAVLVGKTSKSRKGTSWGHIRRVLPSSRPSRPAPESFPLGRGVPPDASGR